jgi:serine/threonine-protein kinase
MTSSAHDLDSDSDAGFATTADPGQTGPALPVVATRPGRYSGGELVGGKYQLCQILGEGGMGSVWVARNRTLDVEVALKLMRSELAEDVEGIAERMLQEARAAACIGHPAIIQVFDFGFTEHGDPFIVMELLRGESLAQAIRRRGRVNPVRAAQTLLPIVDALSAAHRRGIVHRDLKPENIFLSRPAGHRLQPKVLDFGIAKLEQRANERLTRDGAVIGSPAYMAPEQLRGDPHVDARADVWSLGVVLFQMITGQRPFEGANYHASMWNILNAEPRSLADCGVDDPELAWIVQQCLIKDMRARYADMRAFGQALARWLLAQGVQEDVGNASLTAWLEPAVPAGAALNSFFPSDAPNGPPAPLPAASPALASGTRRVTPSGPPKAAPRQASSRRASDPGGARLNRAFFLVPLAAIGAFVGAALWTNRSSEEDAFDPVVERRAARASLSAEEPKLNDTAPDGARGVLSPLVSALSPRPVEEAAPAPPKRPPPRAAAAKRAPKKSELKNPFE